jgi:AraC-type DNA-binding domain-containing proteins
MRIIMNDPSLHVLQSSEIIFASYCKNTSPSILQQYAGYHAIFITVYQECPRVRLVPSTSDDLGFHFQKKLNHGISESIPSSSFIVLFTTSQLNRFFSKYSNFYKSAPHSYPTAFLNHFIESLMQWSNPGFIPLSTLIEHKFDEILLVLHQQLQLPLQQLIGNEWKNPLLLHPKQAGFMQLPLKQWASHENKSLSTFKRHFKTVYGIPPARYMRKLKLEQARRELMEGRNPSQIYMDYGYESLSNFTQAFKKTFGYTPGQARKKYRNPFD